MNNGKLKGTIRPQGVLKGRISRVIETVDPVIQPLEVTENGEYTAPENVHGFNPVKVDVPIRYEEGYQDGYKAMQDGLQEKEITANGEYTADEGHTGFKKVNVNVSFDNIGKPFIDTSKMTRFYYFFDQNQNLGVLDGIDTSNAVSLKYMFNQCTNLTAIPHLNTSKVTNFSSMCVSCNNLESFPQIDTSNGTNFAYMFDRCNKLANPPQLDTSNGTNFMGMYRWAPIESIQLDISNGTNFNSIFFYCTKLKTVSLTTAKGDFSTNSFENCGSLTNITIGEGWAVNIYLHYSNKLTVESLHGMIENLADFTGQTAKTFRVGATNLAKIDEAHIQMLNDKNWAYS